MCFFPQSGGSVEMFPQIGTNRSAQLFQGVSRIKTDLTDDFFIFFSDDNMLVAILILGLADQVSQQSNRFLSVTFAHKIKYYFLHCRQHKRRNSSSISWEGLSNLYHFLKIAKAAL